MARLLRNIALAENLVVDHHSWDGMAQIGRTQSPWRNAWAELAELPAYTSRSIGGGNGHHASGFATQPASAHAAGRVACTGGRNLGLVPRPRPASHT